MASYQVVFIGRNRETKKVVKTIIRTLKKPWFEEGWQFDNDLQDICDRLSSKFHGEIIFKAFVESSILSD